MRKKIDVAPATIEFTAGRRAKQVQPLHAITTAQISD
jgi:hypothetical protein